MKITEKLERREREEQKAEGRTAEEWNVLDHEDIEAGREEPTTPLSFPSATGRHNGRRDRREKCGKEETFRDKHRLVKFKSVSLLYREYLDSNCFMSN